ncbi:MAG: Lrp/AsnC family transcriptional regulator [Chloroflexota bacterium]
MNEHNGEQLDALDYAIINQLKIDGRMSFTKIAEALDVPVSTIRHRYTNLIETGILSVEGWVVPQKMGAQAFASIYLSIKPPRLTDQIAGQIMELPETSFVAKVIGEYDLMVDVVCWDNTHLNQFISEHIHTIEAITNIRVFLMLEVYKYGLPDVRQLYTNRRGSGE